jgi:hypothetical protein
MTPKLTLRLVGIVGVIGGLLWEALTVGAWALYTRGGEKVPADLTLAGVDGAALGLLTVVASVGALMAASRFPVIAQMARLNAVLTAVAVTLAVGGSVALGIMGSLGTVMWPILSLVLFNVPSSTLRGAKRLPEARTAGEA